MYGCTIPVGTPPQAGASRFLAVTLRTCFAINRDAHQKIRYPNNYQALPAALKTRIKVLLAEELGGADRRWGWRMQSEQRFQSMVRGVQEAWVQGTDPTLLNYYRCLAPVVDQHQSGNCGEYVSLVVNMLLDRGVQESRIRLLKGSLGRSNNHICVVVDAAPDADPADGATYGGRAVICDAWLDLVAAPVEFFRVLDVIECEFEPDTLNVLNDNF